MLCKKIIQQSKQIQVEDNMKDSLRIITKLSPWLLKELVEIWGLSQISVQILINKMFEKKK